MVFNTLGSQNAKHLLVECLREGHIKEIKVWSMWLAQLEEHATVDFRVVSSRPTLDVEIKHTHT